MQNEVLSTDHYMSELAKGAALVRALSTYDVRNEIAGRDSLAELFLAEEQGNSLKDPAIRDWLVKNYIPAGVYAYTIARTAFFDHVVEQAFREKFPQVVTLGAGYDSRPYRFSDLNKETTVFELDDDKLSQRKRQLLQKAGISLPASLKYATLSYESKQLGKNLADAGFDAAKQTLFVWEGATYYLKNEEVDQTIRFMAGNSPAGSALCFDYNTASQEGGASELGKELAQSMYSPVGGDSGLFTMDEWKAGVFLAERDFMILEHLSPEEMEKRYLTLNDGTSAGKVPARHRIIYASLSK